MDITPTEQAIEEHLGRLSLGSSGCVPSVVNGKTPITKLYELRDTGLIMNLQFAETYTAAAQLFQYRVEADYRNGKSDTDVADFISKYLYIFSPYLLSYVVIKARV